MFAMNDTTREVLNSKFYYFKCAKTRLILDLTDDARFSVQLCTSINRFHVTLKFFTTYIFSVLNILLMFIYKRFFSFTLWPINFSSSLTIPTLLLNARLSFLLSLPLTLLFYFSPSFFSSLYRVFSFQVPCCQVLLSQRDRFERYLLPFCTSFGGRRPECTFLNSCSFFIFVLRQMSYSSFPPVKLFFPAPVEKLKFYILNS